MKLKHIIFVMMAAVLLTACSQGDTNDDGSQIKIVTSFTIIENIVSEIGGDSVDVHNLVPVGTDPHDYDPLPDDIKAATDADLLFYNGLNLEGNDSGWFAKMIESVGQDKNHTVKVTEGVKPMYLTEDGSREEEINPHAFLDPHVGMTMAENVRDALVEFDEDNASLYKENFDSYIAELEEVAKEYEDAFADIPEERRVLVTSERAFQYMADRYDLLEGYIWAIDTEENGTPEQITNAIEFIEKYEPPVLFVETNVDRRRMETVSRETGVDIYGEIFSDEIGKPGEPGDSYVKFLKHNIEIIAEGLEQ